MWTCRIEYVNAFACTACMHVEPQYVTITANVFSTVFWVYTVLFSQVMKYNNVHTYIACTCTCTMHVHMKLLQLTCGPDRWALQGIDALTGDV